MLACPACGLEAKPDEVACSNCGTPVEGISEGKTPSKRRDFRSDDGLIQQVRKATEETWAENSERIKEAASELDEQVHKNPWPYLGGVAIGALLLGFILGNSRQR